MIPVVIQSKQKILFQARKYVNQIQVKGSPCFDLPLKTVSWFFACIYCFLTYPRSVLWPTVHILFSDLLYFCRMCFLTYPLSPLFFRLCFLTYPKILNFCRLCFLTYPKILNFCRLCFLTYPMILNVCRLCLLTYPYFWLGLCWHLLTKGD